MEKLYSIWANMKARCNNSINKNIRYKNVTYTKDLECFENFKNWALQSGYTSGLSIDRIDCTKNYEPSNCRWIPLQYQSRNRRGYGRSKYKGVIASKVIEYPWKAHIFINKKSVDLGCFKTEEGAAYAYNEYCIQNNIEYAFLNDVPDSVKEVPYIRQTKSQYVGVKFIKDKSVNPWKARYVQFKSKEITIGYYATEIEAAMARDAYVLEHNLKVRRLNFGATSS